MQKNILSWMGLSGLVMALSGCVAAAPAMFAGAAGTGTANVAGSTVTVPQQLTDIKIKGQISGIATTLKIANANIEATVFNGIVLLLGQVPTQQNKMDLAAQIAALPDVVIVYNQLTVGPNIAFGTYANDTWITSKVKANLLSEVDPLHFVVVTQNGVVYLLGQVTKQEGDDAAKLASQTSGVERVVKIFNNVTVAPAVPAAASASPATVPALAPTLTPAPAAAATKTSGIPEYAPSYNAVDTQIGPAASD
ncbi:MAG: BON domain-containing protein [Gammaproteobacteria bacterium]|nr:BON domain-containing protein [Gammaproteobacteria bacterium]